MFFVRPYLFEFLNEMSQYFEIMIFTASTKDYADLILNIIDPNNRYIKARYYRESTSIMGMEVVKDLTKIKKDLSKIILIDNLSCNFRLQPNNGIHIKTWTDDIWDRQLLYLAKILKNLIYLQTNDFRVEVKKIKECFVRKKQPIKMINSKVNKSNFYQNVNSNDEPDYHDLYLELCSL